MVQINLRNISKEFSSEIRIAAITCQMTQTGFIEAAIREKIERLYNNGTPSKEGNKTASSK